MRLSALTLPLGMLLAVSLPQSGMAHNIDNLGVVPPDPDPPGIEAPVPAEPIADAAVQTMAFDMEHAQCEDLMKLDPEVRRAFLVVMMFLQRKGSLSKIIGPECMFLGEAERVAAIADTALTLGDDRESLYFLSEMHALIVSDTRRNSVAYGMMMEDDAADPVEYFLARRDEAEESAAVARIFAEHVATADPPRAALPDLATEIRTESFVTESPDIASSSSSETERVPSDAMTSSAPGAPTAAASIANTEGGGTSSLTGIAVPEELAQNYVTTSSEASVRPIGPEPEPQQAANSGLWILIAFLALVGIGVLVLVLRNQVSAKQGYIDE